jgi:hypothetical protein
MLYLQRKTFKNITIIHTQYLIRLIVRNLIAYDLSLTFYRFNLFKLINRR